ncbi:MAG: hypothetical protein U0166_06100 [Acidobacteriota bacterium]
MAERHALREARVGWPFDKDKVGDIKKATVYIYSYNITPGSNINLSTFGTDAYGPLTLTGTPKDGQEVTVTYKGEHAMGDAPFAWDLTLKVKLLPRVKK